MGSMLRRISARFPFGRFDVFPGWIAKRGRFPPRVYSWRRASLPPLREETRRLHCGFANRILDDQFLSRIQSLLETSCARFVFGFKAPHRDQPDADSCQKCGTGFCYTFLPPSVSQERLSARLIRRAELRALESGFEEERSRSRSKERVWILSEDYLKRIVCSNCRFIYPDNQTLPQLPFSLQGKSIHSAF